MVSCLLAEGKGGFIRATLLEAFFTSAYEELMIDHVPIWCKNSQGQQVMVEQSKAGEPLSALESGLGRIKAWTSGPNLNFDIRGRLGFK